VEQIEKTSNIPFTICILVQFEVGRGGEVIVLNATFKIFELYRGGQIYWWGKQEFLEKTNELLQVTETLFRTHNFSDD
jgi:hypothetical protein